MHSSPWTTYGWPLAVSWPGFLGMSYCCGRWDTAIPGWPPSFGNHSGHPVSPLLWLRMRQLPTLGAWTGAALTVVGTASCSDFLNRAMKLVGLGSLGRQVPSTTTRTSARALRAGSGNPNRRATGDPQGTSRTGARSREGPARSAGRPWATGVGQGGESHLWTAAGKEPGGNPRALLDVVVLARRAIWWELVPLLEEHNQPGATSRNSL
ncbi:MAG: hypothetical protein Ct9H300mP12_16860 [Acidimicrobiales bacterium]|nr:MAG: hypothetical protein Ct9H300mP12_16860 [Acidimicrobiales bacterium]